MLRIQSICLVNNVQRYTMEDLEITLINYIPFLQNGIHEFIYTPTKPIQLIIGSNGSGKSSLKRQLSPLPGESSDFAVGGMKIVKIGSYELISDFAKGGSGVHYFNKDGINLNTGKTLSIQKILVKETFGITNAIHSLLIGEKGFAFSEMSPSKRKEWLTMLSPSNFDFVMDVFQQATTLLRDKVGAIKHITGKLNSVMQSNTDETETSESVRCNVAMLEKSLIDHRQFQDALLSTIPNKKLTNDKEDILNKIEKTSVSIIKGLQGPLKKSIEGLDIDNLSKGITDNNTIISVNQKEIETLTHRIQQLELYIENIKLVPNAEDLSSLRNEIKLYTEQIPECIQNIDPHPIQLSFIAARSSILDVRGDLVYSDRYNRENIQRITDLRDIVKNDISKIVTSIDSDIFKINRLNTAIAIACKKCGYYECNDKLETIDVLENRISENTELLNKKRKDEESYSEELSEIDLWFTYTKNLKIIKDRNSDINQFFWRSFITDEIYKRSYANIKEYLDQCAEYINIALKLYSVELRQKEIAKASIVVDAYAGMSHSEAIEMLDKYSKERAILYADIDSIKHKNKLISELIQLRSNNDSHLEELVSNLYVELGNIARTEMNTAIMRIEKAIGYQYSRLSELEGRRKLIEELTLQMAELKEDISVYEILTKKLSPNTGLIAKLLTSSINSVIGNMNLIIESVWTYPLVINPCNIEDGKLDYKFPMSIKNNPISVKDISMGSSGQADIIDFAFRMVAYRALEIKSYPLFLDEFGTSFDEQHKFNTTELIKLLSQSGTHPYVFFISHYFGQHGGLSNNETLVMDDANVSVPPVYNKHVIMR